MYRKIAAQNVGQNFYRGAYVGETYRHEGAAGLLGKLDAVQGVQNGDVDFYHGYGRVLAYQLCGAAS